MKPEEKQPRPRTDMSGRIKFGAAVTEKPQPKQPAKKQDEAGTPRKGCKP